MQQIDKTHIMPIKYYSTQAKKILPSKPKSAQKSAQMQRYLPAFGCAAARFFAHTV
jgi:hypothetical protein